MNNKKNSSGIKTDGRRVTRVENEIQSIVSLYIIQNLQSELPGLVTIGRVHVPADLRIANVYVSLLNLFNTDAEVDEKSELKTEMKEKQLQSTIKTLQYRAKDIQQAIDKKLKMKYLPVLKFFPDDSTVKILKIEKILSNMSSSTDVNDIDDDEI